ncbi:MAG: hypothetical protein DHS20C11_36030 [Lysobacteraceae bacterium]|nr:MAG: hypothetical protein DHS20C11_36030 [Xanthomonadaceae bacterium]
MTQAERLTAIAATTLKTSAQFWFIVAAIGQWIFVGYILVHYAGPLLSGGLEAWNASEPGTYIAGDWLGNLAIAVHILLAIVIIGGGPLQLMPPIRARFPAFHRMLGRVYIPSVIVTSVAGLYTIWMRGTVGDLSLAIGITIDAILIIAFAIIALRHAMARRIAIHRMWALRLFMVVSAVWFFRVGFMMWMFLTGGAGIDMETFTGPFVTTLTFAQYLLPLAILELYLRARDGGSVAAKLVVSSILVGFTLLMGIGIFMATMGMWFPGHGA